MRVTQDCPPDPCLSAAHTPTVNGSREAPQPRRLLSSDHDRESVEFGHFMDDPSAPKLHVTVAMREVPVELMGLLMGLIRSDYPGNDRGRLRLAARGATPRMIQPLRLPAPQEKEAGPSRVGLFC